MISGIVFFWGLEKYTTSQEQFCMSCHYRQGYSDFWRGSEVHPASVTCPECHAKPGQLIPKGYSAKEGLINSNCVRCHQSIITDEQTGYKFNVRAIKIPHKFHIEDVGTRCTTCHNAIRHDRTPEPTNRPHMTACFECHQQTEAYCRVCHPHQFAVYSGSLEFLAEEVPDMMYEAGVKCTGCHRLETEMMIRWQKERCLACHEEGYDEMMVDWQQSTSSSLKEVEDMLAELEKKSMNVEEESALKDVRRTVDDLRKDGSLGVHNPVLAEELLSQSKERLTRLVSNK
ncbi:MAG: cytochrome c3 family protein [bacterium]